MIEIALTNQQKKFKRYAKICKKTKNYLACMKRKLRCDDEKEKKKTLTKEEREKIINLVLLTPPSFFVGAGMVALYKKIFGISADTIGGIIMMIVVGIIVLLLVYKFLIND